MSKNDDKVVPVAGINHHQKSNSFPGAARNSGGAWAYPEDVPSTHMRKHNQPRRWTLRGADLARFGYPICEGEE